MSGNRTTQLGNTAAGDIVGRDKHENIYLPRTPTRMGELADRFRAERDAQSSIDKIIVEKLMHYHTTVDSNAHVIGLDAKLRAGGYASIQETAAADKEAYVKRLMQHQFSVAAQNIHADALAYVYTRFNAYVAPLIRANQSQATVLGAVNKEVVEPVRSLLEDNVLELYADELNGMVYFLTGNCHLRWT